MAGDDQQDQGHWISIDDFTPGIHEDFFANSQGGNTLIRNGAATRTNTYRCYADPITGALTPLPKATAGSTDSPWTTLNTSYYPTSMIGMYVLDAVVESNLYNAALGYYRSSTPDSVFVMYGAWFNSAGTGTNYRPYLLGREYRLVSSTTKDFWFGRGSTTATPPMALPPGGIERGMYASATYVGPGTGITAGDGKMIAFLASGFGTNTTGAIAAAEQALTTFDTDVSANYLNYQTAFARHVNNDSTVAQGYPGYGKLLVLHQGRLCTFGFVPQISANGQWNSNVSFETDHMWYSLVRQPGTGGANALLMEENQSGFGAVASLTADQLFVVKNYGGGYLLRGSLSNPTVVRLPFVQSTEGVASRPALSPLGVVYGTRTGVYAYAGGDTSEKLSPQLDGMFWRSTSSPTTEQYGGIESRFEYWDPFVCVGNNFLFDTRTKSWWRLDIPSDFNDRPFSHYSVSAGTGKLYAFHYKLDAASRAVWQTFDRTSLAGSWSWQSQPLVETQTPDMWEFQELEIITMRPTSASDTCTVAVTLTGYDYNGASVSSPTTTFNLATNTADQVAIMRQRIDTASFTARHVQVKIVASSSTGVAPKVFPGVRFWCRRARQMPNSA